jgi:hypothetical protein
LSTSPKENYVYSTLHKALTTQDVMVRSRMEDPDVLSKRKALIQSKRYVQSIATIIISLISALL